MFAHPVPLKNIEASFFGWKMELELGFNLLFTGIGDKRPFLDHFRKYLSNFDQLVVEGSKVTVAKLGQALTQKKNATIQEIVAHIKKQSSYRLLIFVYDMQQIIQLDVHDLLSQLAKLEHVSMLAFMDHVVNTICNLCLTRLFTSSSLVSSILASLFVGLVSSQHVSSISRQQDRISNAFDRDPNEPINPKGGGMSNGYFSMLFFRLCSQDLSISHRSPNGPGRVYS